MLELPDVQEDVPRVNGGGVFILVSLEAPRACPGCSSPTSELWLWTTGRQRFGETDTPYGCPGCFAPAGTVPTMQEVAA